MFAPLHWFRVRMSWQSHGTIIAASSPCDARLIQANAKTNEIRCGYIVTTPLSKQAIEREGLPERPTTYAECH